MSEAPHFSRDERRRNLVASEPALGLIRDAHDNHKHGGLDLHRPRAASQGQRPEQVTRQGLFLNHPIDGLIGYSELVFTLDDGTEKEIYGMLHEAMQAWERELFRRGI
jgi:hypothetical protein